ncbi:serine-rich adhesin for platelets-like isoform X2 [Aythya fuligula]|uniref:Serine-rich adhesin for platelets-like isoform X2 n=1 Tax=Aythya fuligula TaxID=219594 RepID=A0A6J3CUN2_AYTFU|nr:serine-rich adhesin for platelets-like isoform X2 [Aythya fuligula]
MCRRAGCGQCVSEEHQGIFHSVNLLDTVFQEEKLTFFSSLKKMRIINEKLMNEVSSHPNDTDMVVNSEADIIALEFGEIFRTLEMKKQQLIEDLENQRSKKEKEFQIWKKMKETHKKTIENFLKDCEKLVHECDPQRFLEVACGLNARMKTQLDLMSIASSYEKPPEYTQKKMDIKPVVNEILALKLVPVNVDIAKDLPSGGNQNSTKNTIKQWQDQKNMPKMFIPVAGQEEALTDGGRICTRLMSISEMSAFQNMSHEELRYKYYMERQKLADEFKTETLPANKKHKFVAAEALKDKSSGIPSVSLPTTANNTNRVNMGILQKEGGFDELNFFGTGNHRIPYTATNFSEKNGNLSLVHERGSEETTTPALSENTKDLLMREKMPVQSSAVTVSNGVDTNSSILGGVKPAASVAVTVSNSEFLDVSAERPSSPFAFGACSNSLPKVTKDAATFSFKKEASKYVFPKFYLGKCDREAKAVNQGGNKFGKHSSVTKTTVSDASNSCNVELAESEKTCFSFPFGNSERDCSAVSGVSNSSKILPLSSFSNQSEKPADQNTLSHMVENAFSPKKTVENDTLKPPVSVEQKANASESITTAPCSTSETGIAAGVDDVSESSLLPSTNGTEKSEQEKMKPLDKTPLNLVKSASPECAETASRHSHPKDEGSFPMGSSKKIESAGILADSNSSCSPLLCSAVLPAKDENASSDHLTITSTQREVKVKDQGSIAENNCSVPGREDELKSRMLQNAVCSAPGMCNDSISRASVLTVNESGGMLSDSDSDTEALSQTSVSSDTSSVSEYFSVAEDKIPTRRKSEA